MTIELISSKQCSDILGVSYDTFRKHIKHTDKFKKYVKPIIYRDGAHPKFNVLDVHAYVDSFKNERAA